jgi:hypothetical protein
MGSQSQKGKPEKNDLPHCKKRYYSNFKAPEFLI